MSSFSFPFSHNEYQLRDFIIYLFIYILIVQSARLRPRMRNFLDLRKLT